MTNFYKAYIRSVCSRLYNNGKPLINQNQKENMYDMTFQNQKQKANIKILDVKNSELTFPIHYNCYMDNWLVSFPYSYHKNTVKEIESILNKNKVILNSIKDHKSFRYQRFHTLSLKCNNIQLNCRPYTIPRILTNAGYNYIQIQNHGFYELGTDPYCFKTQMLEANEYLKITPIFNIPDFNILLLCEVKLKDHSINPSKYDLDLKNNLKLPNSVYIGF